MAMRGPQAFMNTPELIFFEGSRQPIIVASISLRRKTILANPEWKSIPWTLHPERKTAMQTLYDILADCPEKFIRKDRLLATPETVARSGGLIIKLLTELSEMLGRLSRWKETWDIIHPDAFYECSPSSFFVSTPTVPANDGYGTQVPAWTTILAYKSAYEAIVMPMYNALEIMLVRVVGAILIYGQLDVEIAMRIVPERLLTSDARRRAVYNASIDICRSVGYCLRSAYYATLSLNILFPLRVAYDGLGDSYPSIGAWMRLISDEIGSGQRGRWAAAKHLLDTSDAAPSTSS